MDPDFWHRRWKDNDIGFHLEDVNPSLTRHWHELAVAPGGRILLPLCGKTRDIAWLRDHGYRIAGAELSATAIAQLFGELELEPRIEKKERVVHYAAEGIDILVGDVFHLTAADLGPVDAVYDRAALVALPDDMRRRYAAHLMDITGTAPQLLLSFEYDQTLMDGPPFSVTRQEIRAHYGAHYTIRPLADIDIPGGLKGKGPAREIVSLLQRKES